MFCWRCMISKAQIHCGQFNWSLCFSGGRCPAWCPARVDSHSSPRPPIVTTTQCPPAHPTSCHNVLIESTGNGRHHAIRGAIVCAYCGVIMLSLLTRYHNVIIILPSVISFYKLSQCHMESNTYSIPLNWYIGGHFSHNDHMSDMAKYLCHTWSNCCYHSGIIGRHDLTSVFLYSKK